MGGGVAVAAAVSSTHTIACGVVMCRMMFLGRLINSNRQPGRETDVVGWMARAGMLMLLQMV